MADPDAPAGLHVDEARLWSRLMDLAEIGATARGGVCRLALTETDIEARQLLIGWARDLGLAVFTDEISNLFFRLEGRDRNAPPVMTGSHIDSQPTGGKFDGAYGVLAGFEAVQSLQAAGITPEVPVEIVVWLNEEGSRFSPGMMGSEAFTGRRPVDEILAVTDAEGVSTETALAAVRARFAGLPELPLQRPVSAYVEAHIEQGPVLEERGYPVGAVTGMQGSRRFRVRLTGAEAHAGTEPMATRRDALFAANDVIRSLRDHFAGFDDRMKFTVGLFEVAPNVPSVVPASVLFSIDLRHPDQSVLTAAGDAIADLCQRHARLCSAEVRELANAESLVFPDWLVDLVSEAAAELSIPCLRLLSLAGHDARQLHYHCPSVMLFVPCHKGISHNEAESCTPGDLANGARVLANVLARLSASPLALPERTEAPPGSNAKK